MVYKTLHRFVMALGSTSVVWPSPLTFPRKWRHRCKAPFLTSTADQTRTSDVGQSLGLTRNTITWCSWQQGEHWWHRAVL